MQVFMTRRDKLQCVHEPFGDAFYYGPERLSSRYENDKQARLDSGFSESTYKTILDRIDRENSEVGFPLGVGALLTSHFPCRLFCILKFARLPRGPRRRGRLGSSLFLFRVRGA
jgi:hypothetical protein